ncbi:hypothetical protein ACJMK2_035422 [Sinanodonta woodiana]|uniref:Aromatic amino acid beta-eliminating lyase/threonine aldolase domain-containing protein n=1 Tax=Sinanodonta woodiana TaxID=1069815 RepID=A0ABD3WUW0_SINWO
MGTRTISLWTLKRRQYLNIHHMVNGLQKLTYGPLNQYLVKQPTRCEVRAYSSAANGPVVIDLRSDTITKPTPAMREAMAKAVVGDDVYGEDPTVNELQDRCAKLFGMEAALFVPTGTMGNLISILTHCQQRGLEAILGDQSHIFLNEQGGIAQFAGVLPRSIKNKSDGTFDLAEMKSKLRPMNDPHQTRTKLICLENTHNFCGGKVLPLDFLQQVHDFAQKHDLIVHMDGARVMNAAVALQIPVSEILKHVHTVSVCFSKGMAAPVGSVIGGNKKFIDMAIRMRKALGGGTRQVGVLAAAALVSLDQVLPRLHVDHAHARIIAEAIHQENGGVVSVDVEGVHSNIIVIHIIKEGILAKDLVHRLMQVTKEENATLGKKIHVKTGAMYDRVVRIVTHNDLDHEGVLLAINKIHYVLRELSVMDSRNVRASLGH